MTAKTSVNTAHKMASFRTIMEWHTRITRATRGTWFKNKWPFRLAYLYLDLYAGPGWYHCENYIGPGSPSIAYSELRQSRMAHRGILFNNDADEYQILRELMRNNENAEIINDDNKNVAQYLECHSNQFGLAYFDPNNVRFDYKLGKVIVDCLPLLDLLFYLSGSVEKRYRNSPSMPSCEKFLLLEKMEMLKKKSWYVYELHSNFQYTFLLGTNATPRGWKKMGWHSIKSQEGHDILYRLNWTGKEIRSMNSQQLALGV